MEEGVQWSTVNITYQAFRDPDTFAEGVKFPGRMTPLKLEPFLCELVRVDFGDISFMFTRNGSPLRAAGPRPSNRITFAFLLGDTDDQKVVSHSRPIDRGTLFGFDCDRDSNIVLLDRVMHCHALVQPELFRQYLQLTGREDINHQVLSRNFISIPATIGPLKNYFKGLYQWATNQDASLQAAHFQQLVKDDFMPLLIQAIPPAGQPQTEPLRPYRRADLVTRAERFLEENLDQPITLKTLCESLFASQRALFYGFEEMLGTTPMAYLKVMRLQAIHRALKATAPGARSIAEIAQEHGFYSQGHFIRAYKTLFGQTPGKTLKQTT
jgi:AraC family ethanolamine operon transcriptional activator